MNWISVVYLEGFTDSIYTVYTGDKPKPNVNFDAQIFPLPCWLLSLRTRIGIYSSNFGFASIRSRYCCHLGGALLQRLQLDARFAEVASARAASAAGILMVVW